MAFIKIGMVLLILLAVFLFYQASDFIFVRLPSDYPEREQVSVLEIYPKGEFYYNFEVDGLLQEAGNVKDSASTYWWLSSGGLFIIENGSGKTVQGELDDNYWVKAYENSNPEDTDGGRHPQNIFRFLTRSRWGDSLQEVYFKINKINMSSSVNRDRSNGIFLMHYYQDGDNLYYAGVRVDGDAVIKKKEGGKYYTLAEAPLFSAESGYKRETNPNLIPGSRWIGIRSEVSRSDSENARIVFSIDKSGEGDWESVLEAIDDGTFGKSSFFEPGLAGIRSDFMDVEFDNYCLLKI